MIIQEILNLLINADQLQYNLCRLIYGDDFIGFIKEQLSSDYEYLKNKEENYLKLKSEIENEIKIQFENEIKIQFEKDKNNIENFLKNK